MDQKANKVNQLIGCDLKILPRNKVSKILMSKSKGSLVKWILSIGDPLTKPPTGYVNIEHRLRLEFEDDTDPNQLNAPQVQHVQRIINFAKHFPSEGIAVIHCDAGISRSSAAAVITLKTKLPQTDDESIVHTVLNYQPGLHPNKLMLELADQILKTELANQQPPSAFVN
jgi:predicted protein tyrosine phosphatase